MSCQMDQLTSVGFGTVHGATGMCVFIDINKEGTI